MASSACLRAIAFACILFAASAYPTFWVNEDEAKEDCQAHPIKDEGQHPAPVVDKTTTFTVTEQGSAAPVASVCPGSTYTVVAKFAEPRRALLTTSVGALKRAAEPTCPSRSYTTKAESPAATWEDVLTVPCTVTGAAADLKVTSATGKSGAFQNAAVQLPLKPLAQCPKSTCAPLNASAALAAKASNTTANATAAAKALPLNATTAEATAPAAEVTAATAAPAAGAPAAAAKSSAALAAPVSLAVVALSMLAVFGF